MEEVRPQFRLPEHAVRFAFAIAERPICDGTRIFSGMMGAGSVRLIGDEPLSAWDRVSQAGIVMAILRRHLTPDHQAVLVGRYSRPISDYNRRLKEKCLWRVMNQIRPGLEHVPMHYFADAIRGWAYMPRHHNDLWWADHLDVETRTIRNWCRGRRFKGRRFWGILNLLESKEQECYSIMLDPMTEAGLVE